MSKFCAIDVGSNAIRMCIAHYNGHAMETIDYTRLAVRLGGDVFGQGYVGEATADAAVNAFELFADRIAMHKPIVTRAVATSALREAKNRKQIIKRIAEASGIDVELISGEEEASLIFTAVSNVIDVKDKTVLLIDIGGGSVEISVAAQGAIDVAESFNMGTVRLLQLLDGARDDNAFHRLLDEYASGAVDAAKSALGNNDFAFAIGTGGNIEALGELAAAKLGTADPGHLTAGKLKKLIDLLESLSTQQRVEQLALRPDRADVIVPAAVVLHKILKRFSVPKLRIPGVGVKDGILLQSVQAHLNQNEKPGSEHVLPSARRLAKRYGVDLPHAENVARFALLLFDATTARHGLGDRERLLLHTAALLHDVGKAINIHGHHKHTLYVLRHTVIVGLTPRERELVAHTARYHRKSLPKRSHLEYQALADGDRRIVDILGGLLRLANAMDIEHTSQIQDVNIDLQDERLILNINGPTDLLMEEWAMRRRSLLCARALDVNVEVQKQGKAVSSRDEKQPCANIDSL